MANDLTLDLWTFDAGVKAASLEAYAEDVVRRVEESWESGADLVLLPEFTWMGLEPLVKHANQPSGLHAVAEAFWHGLLPYLKTRLMRDGKVVVAGTVPFFDAQTGSIRNRAPIFQSGQILHQDKTHLTPWEQAFSPGDSLRIWSFRGLRVAVVICMDIEIPELAARLRDQHVDLILCPSATETILGVERVNRCASARAVELGCYVGVAHLTGRVQSELIDHNIGRAAFYRPSLAAFANSARTEETVVSEAGCQALRARLSPHPLEVCRRLRVETNPANLGLKDAGIDRPIQILSHDH